MVVKHEEPLQKIQAPIPKPTGTEIVIKVTHCGVCHSDLHFWDGWYDIGDGKRFTIADRGVTLPRAMGHEILGTVYDLGPDAKEFLNIGDVRIVYPWLGCGNCARCDAEQDNMCLRQRSLGVLQDGGFASHVRVPHPRYLVDPGDVDPAIACTFGCSGITVYNSISKVMPLRPDEPILLIGAGGLGLAAIAMLRALGHQAIFSVDIDSGKRAAAVQAGATAVIDSSVADAVQQVLATTRGPVMGIIDFVNNSATATLALAVLNKGGTLVQVGLMGGGIHLPLTALIFKAQTIVGNLTGNPGHLRKVTELARAGKLAPIPVTTMPWDEAEDALNRLRQGKVTGRLILVKP